MMVSRDPRNVTIILKDHKNTRVFVRSHISIMDCVSPPPKKVLVGGLQIVISFVRDPQNLTVSM